MQRVVSFVLCSSCVLLLLLIQTSPFVLSQQSSSSSWNPTKVWNTTSSMSNPSISPSSIGFLGIFVTTDSSSGNDLQIIISADYRSGELRAVRSDNGNTVYTRTYAGIGRSVAVSDANGVDFAVVTTDYGASLQAFRPSNGEPIWSMPMAMNKNITCAPTISGNVLAVRADDQVLAGTVDSSTNPPGQGFSWNLLNFTLYSPGVPDSELAPLLFKDNQMIFVIDSNQVIYGINISSGVDQWNHTHHATPIASPNARYFPLLNRIMFLGTDGNLHSHDADTGATAWKYPLTTISNPSQCNSAFFYDETRQSIFVACQNPAKIVAVTNLTAGAPGADRILSVDLNPTDANISSGAVFSNSAGTIYAGSDDGTLYVVDMQIASNQPLTATQASLFSFPSSFLQDQEQQQGQPSTFVPVLSTATDASATTPLVILGNQNQLVALNGNSRPPQSSTNPPPPPGNDDPLSSYVPLVFDIDIGKPDAYFNILAFINNLFATLGIDAAISRYRIDREAPLGGSLFRARISFDTESLATQVLSMSSAQMEQLNIKSLFRFSPSTSAAPVLRTDRPGPLGIAIGVTCGIVAVFLILFFYGIWHSSKENTSINVAGLSKRKSSTAHVDFQMENVIPANDSMVDYTSAEQQQQGNYNDAFSTQSTPSHHNNSQNQYTEYARQQSPQQGRNRAVSFDDNLLGGPQSAAGFDANDL